MGEAKLRKAAARAQQALESLVDRDKAFAAVRDVVTQITYFNGADCLLYAQTGAGLLKACGIDARAVAGSAAWRVGPGDHDVISHDLESASSVVVPGGDGQAALFHAWIEYDRPTGGTVVVDFTTGQLASKAQAIDEIDGQVTTVTWCPTYLWGGEAPEGKMAAPLKRPVDVTQSYAVGVFSYVRDPAIERRVFTPEVVEESRQAIAAATLVYRQAVAGNQIRVVGVGPG